MNREFLRYWPLDPAVTYLNHGAFGACPWPVLHEQSEWRARLEREPTLFMEKHLEAHLDDAHAALAEFLNADPDDLCFVPNATAGVNTVLRSLEFETGDEILTTDHEYNACLNVVRLVAARSGAKQVVANVPLPLASADDVVAAIVERATPRTRLAVISHVTSPTGLIFPAQRLVAALEERGIDTLVDGAHAPGMLHLDLTAIGAAYYTGNGHKWLNSPKGSAFVHVRRDRQDRVRPLLISHGANSPRRDRSRFRLEADWGGTGDPTPYLCIPAALGFSGGLLAGGWSELRASNRSLALAARERLNAALGNKLPLAPDGMIGSIAAVELPPAMQPPAADPRPGVADDTSYPLDPLHDTLFAEHRIEVPVYPWPHTPADTAPRHRLLRISAQVYNSADDYERLATALESRI